LSSSDGNDFINMNVEDEHDMNEEIHDNEDFQNRDRNFDELHNNIENVFNDEVYNILYHDQENYFLKIICYQYSLLNKK